MTDMFSENGNAGASLIPPMHESCSGRLAPEDRELFASRDKRGIGIWGEDMAAAYLVSKGLEIIDRNVRMRFSELDIVCREDDELVFVEVRCRRRNSVMSAEQTIGVGKWKKLVAGAENYVMGHNWEKGWRIDMVTVDVGPEMWRMSWLKYLEM